MVDYGRIEEVYGEATSGLQDHWFVADPPQEWYAYVSALPKHLRVTYAVVVLHGQVLNGGFEQYFDNRYGDLLGEFAALALNEIGADTKAAIVTEMLEALRTQADELGIQWLGRAMHGDEVFAVLDAPAVEVELDLLTDKYYEDKQNPFVLLSEYLQRL